MASTQSSTRARLTKTTVEAAGPGTVWDADLRGYGLRVSPKLARTYFVHGRTPSGRQVKVSIGRHGQLWTAEQARAKAKQLLGGVAAGDDPAAERRQAKKAEKERREAPTVADLMASYMAEHALRRKRASSIRSDRCLTNRHILPALGARKVAAVTRGEVERLHSQISVAAPGAANRMLALLSKAMGLATKWGWRGDNPCKGLERNPEERRERFLSAAEMERLAAALNRRGGDRAVACIAFLMLTGARRGETLAARWQDFDQTAGVWVKPSAHTKQKKLHRVPLNAAARAVLAALAERWAPHVPAPDGYVFGGPEMVNRLRSTWEAVRAEAALPNLRLHDLRHSYASILVAGGLSLPIIGALLGHTVPTTTARYAHLADDPLRAATERVGSLWQGLSDGAKADVVPLRR